MLPLYNDKVKQLLTHAGLDMTRPTKFAKGTMYLIYINEEGRSSLNIDEVLCLYLIDVSETVIVNFYKLVACFIQLLRNCMNEFGFEVTTGVTPISKPLRSLAPVPSGKPAITHYLDQIDERKKTLFTQENKADVIAQFANIFHSQYLDQKCNIFPEKHSVKLMQHLNLWLLHRKFTNVRIKK